MIRVDNIVRKTKETDISVMFSPDKHDDITITTGIAFLDHMLTSFATHGNLSLNIKVTGDLNVDTHHTVEDVGIVLGSVIQKVVGNSAGIKRFSHAIIPMDESRSQVAIDVSGRGFLVMNGNFTGDMTGGISNDLFEHFWYSLCINAGITAHIDFVGVNDHHKWEATFKAFGIALGEALTIIPEKQGKIPSTKDIL